MKLYALLIGVIINLFFVQASPYEKHVEASENKMSNRMEWPNGKKAAVSLSYDDALPTHIKFAIPSLNKYNLKGSFYLTLSEKFVMESLAGWKEAALQGHELGNHTVFHPCDARNHTWVKPNNDLNKKLISEMIQEVDLAQMVLQAIDGKTDRTFTAPCAEQWVSDGNYINQITTKFVGIKASYSSDPIPLTELNLSNVPFWAPNGHSGDELIDYVKKAEKINGLASITFHGIGGDHSSVSIEAHNKLLQYLDNNRSKYWTDTFVNISKHVNQVLTNKPENH